MPLYNPVSGIDQYLVALGVKAWNFTPVLANNESTPTSQTIFALMVPTIAGQVYTGVKLGIGTAGAGTPPAHFFVGLATNSSASAQGAMLAQSSNLASSTSLTTTRVQLFPFSATYTESVSLARTVVILSDGAFGTTNVTFIRNANNAELPAMSATGPFLYATAGTAQTALPANAANLPATYGSVGNTFIYWVSLY